VAIVRGKVIDPNGGPVREASVYFVSSPVNMPDIAQLTDDQGQFTLSLSAPGPYVIGVRSDDLGTAESKIEIRGDEPVDVEIRMHGGGAS
jgi:protocatechuate 3,4-dioxygenase beta subunit